MTIGIKGRLDLSVQCKQQVYIFELKTAAPKKAIEQIIEKTNTYKSAGAYGNYQVTLIGLQIDFTERNIVKYQTETSPLKIPNKSENSPF